MKIIKKVTLTVILISVLTCVGILMNPSKVSYADKNTEDAIEENNTNNIDNNGLLKNELVNDKLNNLYRYINNMKSDVELMNELDPVEYFKSYLESGQGNLSYKELTGAIVSFLFKEVKTVLSLSLSIIVIAIMCSLLKNLQASFSSDSISNIAFYACYCILIVILSKSFLLSITIATDVIRKISDFMSALLPILVIMLGSAGGFTQAAT
ncbi:MAG: stage III sporulation protein AE, partial [Clostridium sp.]